MRTAGRTVAVLGDIGSTFTKLVGVSTVDGEVVASASVPTSRVDIAAGVERARSMLGRDLRSTDLVAGLKLSSSAAGGLRVIVLGLEPGLTLAAGLRASATAGARIVAMYARDELAAETIGGLHTIAPDVALLTGGTNGGDTAAMKRNAEALSQIAPNLPVVVAGNEEAHDEIAAILGGDRIVRFARNVMPRVGELDAESAQRELRDLFVDHVIGHGRFASASAVASCVRMPTPAAVLRAAAALPATSESNLLRSPVVVDVGGATTDVHSVVPVEPGERGYVTTGLPDQRVTRTVEGDLGMRENAPSLVAAAQRGGYLPEDSGDLASAAERRAAEPHFLPARDEERERELDERLAEIATAIALERHAGRLETVLTPGGAVLRRTGRDLRRASCLIATGGVFANSERPCEIVAAALRSGSRRGVLVNPDVPVLVDGSYLLWAAGLLEADYPDAAHDLARTALVEPSVR
jgi:uncharacterized protein (TIGR01319 family)